MDNERISAHRVPGSERGFWPLRTKEYEITVKTPDGVILNEFTIRERSGDAARKKARRKISNQ